jgi:hypothetical protein
MQQPIRTAVVTGGHSYEVDEFRRLFRSLAGVDAYVQHLEDFASSSETERDAYDVVVFYFMPPGAPTDDGHPWYAGKPRAALEHLGATTQGIVLLHHAILAYPDWPTWQKLAGIAKREFAFHHDQSMTIQVADAEHPVTTGLTSWEMIDETYEMNEPDGDCRVLLTTTHPKSMRSIAWTRTYGQSKVFSLVGGHDSQTWQNDLFRLVLARGILWAAPSGR